MLHGIEKVCQIAGIAHGDIAAGAARHHHRDERDPGGQGRQGRSGHHRGIPAGAADRPIVRARRPGGLDHLAQARTAGRAGEHHRGARADRQRRLGDHPAGRAGHQGATAPAEGQRHRGAGHLADQRLRQRRARAADRARSPRRNCPASRFPAPAWCCRRCASTKERSPPSRTATCSRRWPGTSGTCPSQFRDQGVAAGLSILRSDGGLAGSRDRRRFAGHHAAVRAGRWGHRRGLGRRADRSPGPA